MKTTWATLALALLCAPLAQAQTSDFPGASDMTSVARPASSFIIGAMHIDDDEYQVPIGPVERQSRTLGKTVMARGPIDYLAYAGPTTASTLTTYSRLAGQLTAAGYKEVWSCIRKTCGDPYTLVNLMAQPLIDSIHTGSWAGWVIDDLFTSNEDVRFGSFKKGTEYMMVLGALAPGHPSGALLVRANGPAAEPVLTPPPPAATSQASPAPAPEAPATPQKSAVKDAAKSLWGKIPH